MSLFARLKGLFSSPDIEINKEAKRHLLPAQASHAEPDNEASAITRLTLPNDPRVIEEILAKLKETSYGPVPYLALAADSQRDAKQAVKEKNFDKAWKLFHRQKELYLMHSLRARFTEDQLLALDASVHVSLANVLRLENRHRDALAHILYWVISSRHRPLQAAPKKLDAYFNRCKLTKTTLEDVIAYIDNYSGPADYSTIQDDVKAWLDKG